MDHLFLFEALDPSGTMKDWEGSGTATASVVDITPVKLSLWLLIL